MSNPLVSVCIPVYNSEHTIRQAIECALAQTYQNIEIIIVDNNSTDRTWDIVQSFSDARMRKYRNETNIGMVPNWNKCIDYASGKYIQFLHGDDVIESNCIEIKTRIAESDENISLVFSASHIINENNEILLLRRQFKTDCIIDGKKLAKKSFLSKNLYGEPTNVLFRRIVSEQLFFFSTNLCYSVDWELWMRLSILGNVGYSATPLMKYRISKTNATSRTTKNAMQADDLQFVANLENFGIHFSAMQKFVHKRMFNIRMYMRIIFMASKV